jgi:tetratricopeptide (TPR) repeat protein
MERLDPVNYLNDTLETSDLSSDDVVDKLIALAMSSEEQDDVDLMLDYLAKALARVGRWDRAMAVAQSNKAPYERSDSLREIAARMILQGKVKQALPVLERAEESADRNDVLWQRAHLLNHIAQSFRKAGAYDRADQVWTKAVAIAKLGEASDSAQDSLDSSSVLWDIAAAIASEEDIDKALEIARDIKNPHKRNRAIETVNEIKSKVS